VHRKLVCDTAYQRARDRTKLELHWRLQSDGELLNWDFEKVQGLAAEMPLANANVLVLQPAPQMVYLICHGAKHGWSRLKWLADIYRMADALTDEQASNVVQLSRHAGVMRMLATSLRLLRIVYDIPAERFAGKEIEQHERAGLLHYMIDSMNHVDCMSDPPSQGGIRLADLGRLLQSYRYAMNLRPDLRYRSDVALRLLADQRDIETLRLSQRWLWLYVILGPVLAVARVLKREIKLGW